ncbi:MAG: translation initiation factor IF-2 [Actinobacteria bacterium]|nr:translation initiation factor IF-2 [Actinomycetota bacterium]
MGINRIYQIAKKNNISSKDLLDICSELGIEVKNHMSALEGEDLRKVLEYVSGSKKNKEKEKKPPRKPDWEEEKRLNIRKVLDMELDKEEGLGRVRTRIAGKGSTGIKRGEDEPSIISKRRLDREKPKKEVKVKPEIKKVVEIPEGITIKELSEKISVPSNQMIQTLFNMGEVVNINHPLDKDLLEFLSHEYNFKYNLISFEDKVDEVYEDKESELIPRPPIVTVMGHVDHGKTTLLDAIRQTKVADSEAGGITQKIGAYQIEYSGRKITFIDTPGHEAFTSMRARGAKVTDIAVIVVAADDGVMPQTVEAINHAKDAGVPMIVAINKIDLPNANPNRVKQGLAEHGLVPEEWGGDTIYVEISARKKTNIDELLEMILLVSDLHEIKGNPQAPGIGVIIESRLDKQLGPVGTVIIKRGTIRVGDFFVTGSSYGRIRLLRDEHGNNLKEALLSQPVEVLGFSSVPQAGDRFFIVKNEKVAKQIVEKRLNKQRLLEMTGAKRHITLEDISELSKQAEIKSLKLVLKADSNGSLDAIEQALRKIEEDKIKINIIHKAIGVISDSDILLASASNAIVIGFGVEPTSSAKTLAKEEKVEVRTYDIIYNLIDEIKLALRGLLEPRVEEVKKGSAEVREVFRISKIGTVAGCYVLEGKAERDNKVRVIREGEVIHEGKVVSIRRFKEDVKEVSAGYECGIKIENFQDINKGDILEFYEEKKVLG